MHLLSEIKQLLIQTKMSHFFSDEISKCFQVLCTSVALIVLDDFIVSRNMEKCDVFADQKSHSD